jgi:glycosyltransferase involved in cell wall biosynthesis
VSFISVIICTHNPREDYLRRVLAALRAQTLPLADWELLLVDNASEQPLAGRFDLSWHPRARHVREEKTGLTHARLCGIAAAQADLLVFVDDDNVLYPNYLEAARKIAADYPQLGAWGGSYYPEFEKEPAVELRPWLCGLPLETVKQVVWAKLHKITEATPAGAGIVVRRKLAWHYRERVLNDPLRQTLGRSGKSFGSGEDSDMGLCGFELGLGTGKFPELELTHLIPAKRVSMEYVEKLYEGFGYAGLVLEAAHQPDYRVPKITLGWLKLWMFHFYLLLAGKSSVERRIQVAKKRGYFRACVDLQKTAAARSNPAPPSAG